MDLGVPAFSRAINAPAVATTPPPAVAAVAASVEPIYGKNSWMTPRVIDGQVIEVSSHTPPYRTIVDLANFQSVFEKLQTDAARPLATATIEWLQTVRLDPRIFSAVRAFHGFRENGLPLTKLNDFDYHDVRMARPAPMTISEVIAAKAVRCSDIATLGHASLQFLGVPAMLVAGSVQWPGSDRVEGHMYVLLLDQIVWDPTNPWRATDGRRYPSLFRPSGDLLGALRSRNQVLMLCESVLSTTTAWFGSADNVDFM